jgi:hypothetical protein
MFFILEKKYRSLINARADDQGVCRLSTQSER